MSTGKHTPGPWDLACDSYGKVRHSKMACVFKSGGGPTVAARISNWEDARLIAAAPAMLEALQAVVVAFENHLLGDTVNAGLKSAENLCPCWEGELKQAQAAIRAATGESE